MRKPMMAGNWKMNNTWAETTVLTQHISNRSDERWGDTVDVVLCTPACNLKAAWTVLEFDKSNIKVGAQNVYWEASGAYTGEISVGMLQDIGVAYCIVGHSERRGYFGETDEDVNKKVKALLAGGITPIVCMGESLAVRDAGTYLEFVCNQMSAAFAGLEAEEVRKCVVAYEPIWAIGTGRTATPEQAEEVCGAIRGAMEAEFGVQTADETRILYGGSMKPANVEGLMKMEDIDGGLIGGASLVADDFAQLVGACL
jgi:triosephosphate isomerase